jgi:hypothetical protein
MKNYLVLSVKTWKEIMYVALFVTSVLLAMKLGGAKF